MIPLKDNIPTSRFPILTILLIVANVAVFVWQLGFSSERFSSEDLRELRISESDENTIEYGAIPHRITHPGENCAAAVVDRGGRAAAEIVCEGTRDYRIAEELGEQRAAPFEPLDGPAWWATLLTSMFMHGGILHIAGNMLFLWIFGNNIEDSMGRLRFILFYLLAGLVAAYAQALLDTGSTIPQIGASGAVAGVMGGYILLHPKARVLTLVIVVFFVTLVEIPAAVMLGIWFALQFLPVVGQLATPEIADQAGGVAYLAHVGGFVFGLAAIKLFAERGRVSGPEPPHPVY